MTSTVTYEGYIAHLTIDLDAKIIHGEVVNTRDVLTFSVRELSEVKAAFAETIEDYKEWCASEGQTPQKPLSGTMTFRMSPELHQAAANRAATLNVSLNSWLVQTVECELGRRPMTLTAGEVDRRVVAGVRDEVFKVLSVKTVYGDDNVFPAPWSSGPEVPAKQSIQ